MTVNVLTGYRDFDYAQEAIKLGAFDFMLKPSKIEELVDVVKSDKGAVSAGQTEEIKKLRLYSRSPYTERGFF